MKSSAELPLLARPAWIGPRGTAILLLTAASIAAWFLLDLTPRALIPHAGGIEVAKRFFAGALQPAFEYESEVPPGTRPILVTVLEYARRTVVFATAGMSLALVLGIVLGFFASSAWWRGEHIGGASRTGRFLARTIWPFVWLCTRGLITFMRSVHELLWAVLFLAAFGLNTFGAVIAIAIPYAGTLAKIFSEMIDEAPRDSGLALRQIGSSPITVFAFGLLPRALPDMCAYAFYRFECAIRSSAVLGFFGFPTLGYGLAQAFENLHYHEVWTYLYALMALVIVVELWSGAVRARFVA
ncbi:MAG: ABC transporter permease subunit [Planctomycetes bacterium]|nr:ABC transporter permease subunit [Planctomycetota bacterium]